MDLSSWVILFFCYIYLFDVFTILTEKRIIIRLLEASQEPLNQIESFLNELQEKEIHSPHLYSTLIDVFEQNAKNNSEPIDPQALQVNSNTFLFYFSQKSFVCLFVLIQ